MGTIQTNSPHHPKPYQTVVWKDQALSVLPSGHLRLPTGLPSSCPSLLTIMLPPICAGPS